MDVFLDTNAYLNFYRYSSDDIQELEKLVRLIEGEEIRLITNDHLVTEISRNRESVVSEFLDNFDRQKLELNIPSWFPEMPEVPDIRSQLKEANKLKNKIASVVREKANQNELDADHLIERMFEASDQVGVSDEILERARLRSDLRNPPGKPNSAGLGDQIHWECLLGHSTRNLCFVTADRDFASPLDGTQIRGFLRDEWKRNKSKFSRVVKYQSLGDFVNKNFPDIKVSLLNDTDALIDRLAGSHSFAATHAIIAELAEADYFTLAQVRTIFRALVANDQIHLIGEDDDIVQFYSDLREIAYPLEPDLQRQAATILGLPSNFYEEPF